MPENKIYTLEEVGKIQDKLRNDPELYDYFSKMTIACLMMGHWTASDKVFLDDIEKSYEKAIEYGNLIMLNPGYPITDFLYEHGLMAERIDIDAVINQTLQNMERDRDAGVDAMMAQVEDHPDEDESEE